MHKDDKTSNIITVGVVAAIVKIIVNIIKYTFLRGMIVGGLALTPAFIQAINKNYRNVWISYLHSSCSSNRLPTLQRSTKTSKKIDKTAITIEFVIAVSFSLYRRLLELQSFFSTISLLSTEGY